MILLDPTFPQEGNASMFSVSFVIIIIIIIIIIIMSRSWSEVTQDERYKAAVRAGTI